MLYCSPFSAPVALVTSLVILSAVWVILLYYVSCSPSEFTPVLDTYVEMSVAFCEILLCKVPSAPVARVTSDEILDSVWVIRLYKDSVLPRELIPVFVTSVSMLPAFCEILLCRVPSAPVARVTSEEILSAFWVILLYYVSLLLYEPTPVFVTRDVMLLAF